MFYDVRLKYYLLVITIDYHLVSKQLVGCI